MNRRVVAFVAAVAALAFTCQAADAKWRKHKPDERLIVTSLGVGAAATATYFSISHGGYWHGGSIPAAAAWGMTTIGCAAVSPMVATAVVNRPLTLREAHVLVASCVVPIVGGWIANQVWDAHPEWEAGDKPVHHGKKHHAKM